TALAPREAGHGSLLVLLTLPTSTLRSPRTRPQTAAGLRPVLTLQMWSQSMGNALTAATSLPRHRPEVGGESEGPQDKPVAREPRVGASPSRTQKPVALRRRVERGPQSLQGPTPMSLDHLKVTCHHQAPVTGAPTLGREAWARPLEEHGPTAEPEEGGMGLGQGTTKT
ncbi:unnamed protein product, partial [Rangifer tarandus platyrhynchus]